MNVAGLDISLTATGVAYGQTCRKTGRDGVLKLPFRQRMATIQMLSWGILELVPPVPEGETGLAVVEYPNMAIPAGGQLERAALWWEVVRQLSQSGYQVASPTPGQRLKFLTGKGTGTKGTVIEQVTRRWPVYEIRGDDNMADAVVFLKMGEARLGQDTGIPTNHLDVLTKIDWPEGI